MTIRLLTSSASFAVIAALLGWVLAAGAARAASPRDVEVRLFQAYPLAARLELSGPLRMIHPIRRLFQQPWLEVRSEGNVLVISGKSPGSAPLFSARGRMIIVQNAREDIPVPVRHPSAGTRRYRGALRIAVDRTGHLKVDNILPVADYVTAVVGSETLPDWPLEALKAQAILTQTRLMHYKRGDALDDTTQQEAYKGADYERAGIREAVAAVWGKVLYHGATPIQPFYHAACAGGTSDGGELFKGAPGRLPYLTAVSCDLCRQSPFWKEKTSEVPVSVFARVVSGGPPEPVRHDATGRPVEFRLPGGGSLSGWDLWLRIGQKLGWDKVPGTRYRILSAAEDRMVKLVSTGAGHGVGMCQWGARELALQGCDYQSILKYYFPLAEVRQTR